MVLHMSYDPFQLQSQLPLPLLTEAAAGSRSDMLIVHNSSKIQRVPDWAFKLVQFIQESCSRGVAFEWPSYNCAWWSSDGIMEMTGMDFYEPFKDHDHTEKALARACARTGYKTLSEYTDSLLTPIPIAYARRGDLIGGVPLASGSDESIPFFDVALGLAEPPFYWNLGIDGLATVPLTEATKAWAVGEHPCLLP